MTQNSENKGYYNQMLNQLTTIKEHNGKITFNNEQLEFLKFIVQDFEYNDDHERYMIEQIENKNLSSTGKPST